MITWSFQYKKSGTVKYQEIMKIDVENISKKYMEINIWSYWWFIFWRNGYFLQCFQDSCKNSPSQPQLPPSEVKKVLKKMALGKGLYAQVVMVFQKSYDNKK